MFQNEKLFIIFMKGFVKLVVDLDIFMYNERMFRLYKLVLLNFYKENI